MESNASNFDGFVSFLFKIRFASHVKFPWQYENPTHLPGGSQSVAHQFIRCVLHQLAPNGIFVQMFLTQMRGMALFVAKHERGIKIFHEI